MMLPVHTLHSASVSVTLLYSGQQSDRVHNDEAVGRHDDVFVLSHVRSSLKHEPYRPSAIHEQVVPTAPADRPTDTLAPATTGHL